MASTLSRMQIKEEVRCYRVLPEDKTTWKVIYQEKHHKSEMWTSGVVLQSNKTSEFKWYCLASKKCKDLNTCVNLGKTKSSTNVVKHLKQHSIVSERSITMSANKEKRKNEAHIIEESSLYQNHFILASEFITTMMVIRCLLPQSFVESPGFRFFAQFNCKPSVNQKFHAGVLFHRIVDLYAACIRSMKHQIQIQKKSAKIPMFHLLIDEWWCKLLRQRYIAIRIRFVDENFELVTMLLSIRHFNRNLMPVDMTKASEILLHWLKGVLIEFGLGIQDFYSATTDAGPDVKFMTSNLMGVQWEWCIAHMLTNAVKEACGWLKNKNPIQQEVKAILKIANRVIAEIHNSKPALASFRRICLLRLGKELVLKTYLQIRFVGVVRTLERILEVWDCLDELYITHFGRVFPLPERSVIQQLVGLFNYVKDIQVHSQSRANPVSCTTLLKMLDLDRKHLHQNASIDLEHSVVESFAVHPIVKTTREVLRSAIDKRFYDRYAKNPPARGSGAPAKSMLLEMATVMHPAYAKLSCLDSVIRRRNEHLTNEEAHLFVHNLKSGIQKKVIDLAILVADDLDKEPRVHLEFQEPIEIDELADDIETNLNMDSTESKIRQSFNRYCRENDAPSTRKDQKDILAWWKTKQHDYPYLSVVARAILGSEASSGAIELDIGIAGMFVPKNRLSTRASLLEMKIFIKRNEEFIDWNSVECLSEEMRESYIPSQPVIPFVEAEDSEEKDEEDSVLL